MSNEKIKNAAEKFVSLVLFSNGGAGSGNWGHAGRPGKVGGSAKTTTHSSRIGYQRRLIYAKRMVSDDKIAKDFGYKRLNSVGSVEEALKANPKRGRVNCQCCVIAAEMRFRGLDVEAKDYLHDFTGDEQRAQKNYSPFIARDNDCKAFGYDHNDGSDGKPASSDKTTAIHRKRQLVTYTDGSIRRKTEKWSKEKMADMRKQIMNYPEGSRLLLSYTYTRNKGGHITMVQRVPKDVDESGWRVIESQSGKVYSGGLYDFSNKCNVMFMRIDNKKLNEVIIEGAVDKSIDRTNGKERSDERRSND